MNRNRAPKANFSTLKKWRESHQWSVQVAAKFLGISASAYSRLELGQAFVKGSRAADIVQKTNVPLAVVVGAN